MMCGCFCVEGPPKENGDKDNEDTAFYNCNAE